MQEARGLKIRTYGRSESADVRGTYVGSEPYLHFYFEVGDNVYNVRTHLLGAYNFDNCMAAVAVGLHFGVEPFDIKEAIEEYIPANQRSQWKETANNKLYLDCYNANPSSMAAAIASFAEMNTGTPKVAIIGAMRELGDASVEEHRKLVQALNDCHLEHCLLIGHEFDDITLGENMTLMHATEEAEEWLRNAKLQGKTILVKGSNSNRLWTLEPLL
jgi:UDP-N-acetylmuramoyl-tripeptide--D-alanyl-D-alanine ligase